MCGVRDEADTHSAYSKERVHLDTLIDSMQYLYMPYYREAVACRDGIGENEMRSSPFFLSFYFYRARLLSSPNTSNFAYGNERIALPSYSVKRGL
jgi:hypothetical protein